MADRPKQTLMDYMVIGINPALIMMMIGSLLFYLVTVFYHGQYEGRLTFIFAMFVLAIVLIARISMERGIEYATLFAIPLGVVTLIAMARFVRIQGALANYSMVINVGLIALVWWSAHKLTWDCTLIDDDQDASGEGLLQGMGLDSETVESQAADYVDDGQSESKTKAGSPTWWQRMVDRRHRPHTPGVWVIYYAIAALPLFACGQWMVPAHATAARLSSFRLLIVYVGSAMGLLLTTSFLGLRRYLRQRRLEMPSDMAGIWLGIGAIMILGLLLFCIVLPRPGAALQVSQMPFSFSAPDHNRTHRKAVGNDGPERPQQATQTRQDAQQSGRDGPQKPDGQQDPSASSEQQGASKSGGSESDQKSSQNPAGSKQSNNAGKSSDSQQKGSGSKQTPESSQDRNQSTANRKSNSETESRTSPAQSKASDRSKSDAGGKQSENGSKSRSQDNGAGKNNAQNDQTSQSRGKEQQPQQQPSQGSQQQSGEEQQAQDNQDGSPGSGQQQRAESSNSQPSQQESERSAPTNSSSRSSDISRVFSNVLSNLGSLVKLLFWAVLIGIVAFFGWKYRDRVMQAIRQLLDDLKNLLARLLGGKRPEDDADEKGANSATTVSFKPFSSYADPFAKGGAERYSAEQLVRYTFEALEAWARERSCPRHSEQTPLEFAQQLAGDHPNLGVEAQQLADLYSRVAYGNERVSPDRCSALQHLWRHMRSTAAIPPPPP